MGIASELFEPARVARDAARDASAGRALASVEVKIRPPLPATAAGDERAVREILATMVERMLARSTAMGLSIVAAPGALVFELEARRPLPARDLDVLLDPTREPALASAFARATTLGYEPAIDVIPGKSWSLSLTVPLALHLPPERAVAHAALRVLVVDDDPSIRKMLKLQVRDFAVSAEAGDGAAATSLVLQAWDEGAPFDLVLLDMELPSLDGRGVARALRAAGTRVPIIALTARTLPGDRERCLEAGCDDYVPKPVRRRELLAAIRRLAPSFRVPSSDDGAEMKTLARGFRASLRERVRRLEQATSEGRLDDARRIAHQLKGAAGGFGLAALGDVANEVELAIDVGHKSLLPSKLARLASLAAAAAPSRPPAARTEGPPR